MVVTEACGFGNQYEATAGIRSDEAGGQHGVGVDNAD